MRLYRLLTGTDDAAFCKRVSEALNKGWSLEGSPTMAFDSANGRVLCGQAVTKEVAGEWIGEMMREGFRLGEQ